ncbi:MAG: GNAT family N-acetyltransferase [Candidatus Heimdallarchaeota archaeon]|nr:MAG: GNAT family N-acetyltransferase [Candidatus Heimdallarchaeota archaeon]
MNHKNVKTGYQFRKLKNKELWDFIAYAFESTRDRAEKKMGVSFKFLKRMCQVNRLLLGIPWKLIARDSSHIVVVKDRRICAGFSAMYDKKKNEYTIGNFFTRPEFQGQGIGNLLMEYIVERYGKTKLILYVETNNEVALHLYKKFGFSEKSSMQEFHFTSPFKTRPFPPGFHARQARKEDLKNLHRLIDKIPDIDEILKHYKKSFNKTKERRFRMRNQIPAVLVNDNGEILGIGRAMWTKAIANFVQIIATAVLPEAKFAYPSFISFLTEMATEYDISRGAWEKTEKTEVFLEEMKPYLGEPFRISWIMERVPGLLN